MELQVKLTGKRNMIKVALIAFMFIGFQTTAIYAQDAAPVEEKKEKKKKEKKVKEEKVKEEKPAKEEKDNGKIEKSGNGDGVVKYRRSSLHTMIIEDAKLPKIDIILKTFNAAPVPDKYNDHTVDVKTIVIDVDTSAEAVAAEAAKSNKEKRADGKDFSPEINKFFKDNRVATKMMAKWFNRSPEGGFNMDLIGERGMYDASAQDAAAANSTERGVAMLADAGEELIGNSFVVVNYSKFISNEIPAKIAYDIAVAASSKLPGMAQKIALTGAKAFYEKARQGYSVWTTAYLYQLQYTDSIQAVFYQNMWMDASSLDAAKKELFDNNNLFELKLLGFEKARSLVSGLGKNAQGEEMIIQSATLKSIDAVYAKLEKKFENFRTKTPLVSSDPLGAKIGLKEGLEGGENYEVLEKTVDAEGKVKWKRKGTIKVDKKNIWDNTGDEFDEDGNLIEKKQDIKFTHFKGGKGYYPGMLLRQIN